jgi:hypothetical protein
MTTNKIGRFNSFWDFAVKSTRLFKGPYSRPDSLDPVFPEKIRLSVTFTNGCSV